MEEKDKEAAFERVEKEKYLTALERYYNQSSNIEIISSCERRIEELNAENQRLNGETHDLVAENTKLHKLLQGREGEQADECDLSYFSFANLVLFPLYSIN